MTVGAQRTEPGEEGVQGRLLEDEKASASKSGRGDSRCGGPKVCTGEWQAVLCGWGSENEKGMVGDEAELMCGGSFYKASCEGQGTCCTADIL